MCGHVLQVSLAPPKYKPAGITLTPLPSPRPHTDVTSTRLPRATKAHTQEPQELHAGGEGP